MDHGSNGDFNHDDRQCLQPAAGPASQMMPWRKRLDFSGLAGKLVYNDGVSLLIADPSTAATVEYCRRARKIRASFDRNAFLRHEALTTLARQREDDLASLRGLTGFRESPRQVIQTPVRRRVARMSTPSSDTDRVECEFADAIAAKLQPFGFTFSDRLRLLNQAERLGINRFRANVMLAMHEHQAGRASSPAADPAPRIPSLFAVLIAEFAVVAVIVWALVIGR
jgi:hypothetical protein